MKTRIIPCAFGLALALSLNALGGPAFSDNFNSPDSADINTQRDLRQSGSESPVPYRIVTLMVPSGIQDDQIKIEKNVLSLTNAGGKKAPVSVCPDRNFDNLGKRYRVAVTAHPLTSWAGIQLTPVQKGDWPDTSSGLSLIISPNGAWNLWNNTDKPKQLIGSGKAAGAEQYRVEFDVDETAGRFVTVTINGTKVVDRKAFSYDSAKRFVMLQSVGQTEFDDLLVEPVD